MSTLLLQKDITHNWQGSLDIRIIPVIADSKKQTSHFVDSLSKRDFKNISRYLVSQAKYYNVDLENNLNIKLETPINNITPAVPNNNASHLSIILWSLKLRWWAWKNKLDNHHITQIRLYVLHQSPASGVSLPYSTGL